MLRTFVKTPLVAVGIIFAFQLVGCASPPINPRELVIYQPKLPAGISSVDAAIDDLSRLLARGRKGGMMVDYDPSTTRPGCNSICAERLTRQYGIGNITWWQPQQVAVIELPGIPVYRDFLDIPVSPVYFSSLKGHEIFLRRGAAIPGARLIDLPNDLSLRLYLPDTADAQRIADNLLYIQQNYDKYQLEQRIRFEEQAARYRSLATKPPLAEDQRKFIVQANAFTKQKDYAGALDAYERAIEVDPVSYPAAYFNMALLYAERELFMLAIDRMKRYLALEPEAKDARSARDKMYEWEAMARKAGR